MSGASHLPAETVDYSDYPPDSERLGQSFAPCSAEVERQQRTRRQVAGRCICGAGFAPYCCPRCWPQLFCASHKGCQKDSIVTRIEFEYLPEQHSEEPT